MLYVLAGEVAQVTAFKLAAGNTIKIFIDAKGDGVDCADCGPNDRVPYMCCDGCHQNELSEYKRQAYVIGPNCYTFVSDAPAGEPFVKYERLSLSDVPKEFLCQEACYPNVTSTVSICPVPNCFTWRGKKYLNLADFVADVQTIVNGATYDAATCTFSAPAGSTFPDLTIAACVPCPTLTISAVASGQTSAVVTITGGPATVSISGDCCAAQEGNGPFTFTGLTSGTRYIFTAVSKCGTPSNSECDGCEQATASTEINTDACPAVVLSMAASGTNAVTVTVNSGGAAWVEVGDKKQYVANGATATFSGLQPDTEYFAVATNDCGSFVTASAKTQACPAISLTQVSSTTGSITVTLVAGGPANVTVNGVPKALVNGQSHTFSNLLAGTEYQAVVVTTCGLVENFTLNTLPCPDILLSLSGVTTTSATVDITSGGPVDLVVKDLDGRVLDSADGVAANHTFTDLPEGEQLFVFATSDCGSAKKIKLQLVVPPAEPCPSYWLANDEQAFNGYAFTPGDNVDPAATVAYGDLLLYPTAGEGHTVKVTDVNGAFVGYAANKSDCAGCCVLIPKPIPEADLQVEKSATPETPAVGDTVTWNVTVTNNGPSAADGAIVRDNPPAGLTFSSVAIAYSGGATGAASTTVAAMETGFVLGAFPNGASAVFTYSAVVPAGFEGRALLNNASVEPPEGVVDSNPFNNTAIVVVTVAPACYDELLRFSSGAAGAGVCIAYGGVSYNPFRGRAVFRMRDATWEEGGGTQTGNPGAYLTLSITNPYPEPAMLRVDGFTANNGFSGANGATNVRVGFVTKIGEVLGINMPNAFDLYADPSEIRDILDMSVSTAAGGGDSGDNYGEVTGYGYYKRLLAPGQSVTIYMQSWVILSQQYPFLGSVVHAHMNAAWELHRNAVQV